MTTAVSEILKRAEFLSAEERGELTARLLEQARQPETPDAEPPPPGLQESVNGDGQEEDWLDTLDLKLMPPKRTYTMRVRYHFAGRLKPLPYVIEDETIME